MVSKKSAIWGIVLLGLLFHSCSAGNESEELHRIYKDLSYGTSSSQKVDIAFPSTPQVASKPVSAILFIHGGGWQEGDKDVYESAINDVSNNMGLVAVAMNYRMFGEGAKCADMLADINSALAFTKSFAQKKGVTISKVILMGASAGAHLSLLFAYKHQYSSPIPIAFCVGQSTPSDFTDPNLYVKPYYGSYMFSCASKLAGVEITEHNYEQKKDLLLSISPIYYVNTTIPPTLLAHGGHDVIVPVSNATRLFNALKKVNVPSDLYIYKDSGHELDNNPLTNTEFYNRMLEYIQLYAGE